MTHSTDVTDQNDRYKSARSEMLRILQEHSNALESYILTILPPQFRSLIDPKDILQDTVCEIFKRLGEFEYNSNTAYAWLKSVARHRLLQTIRDQKTIKRRGRQGPLLDQSDVKLVMEEYARYSRTPSQSAMSHEVAAAIKTSLESIKPTYRKAIELCYLEGLTAKQGAQIMGKTELAVNMLCFRGLKAIRQYLPKDASIR